MVAGDQGAGAGAAVSLGIVQVAGLAACAAVGSGGERRLAAVTGDPVAVAKVWPKASEAGGGR